MVLGTSSTLDTQRQLCSGVQVMERTVVVTSSHLPGLVLLYGISAGSIFSRRRLDQPVDSLLALTQLATLSALSQLQHVSSLSSLHFLSTLSTLSCLSALSMLSKLSV